MRMHHAAYRSMRLILFTLLLTSVCLWFATDRPAHAQTGNGSITFVKEATPGSDINFSISHVPAPLGTWGSSGTSSGLFTSPDGIAIGLDGSIYVADVDNHRIQQFDAAGNFVRMWGHDVTNGGGTDFEVCTTDCKAGVSGNGDGQFISPRDVAVGPDGSVYVADTANNRVQQFTATGTFIRQWGQSGSFEGEFENPFAIAVAPNGTVYVTETGNDRVQHFTADGTFIRMWGHDVDGGDGFEVCTISCQAGAEGSADGQFAGPEGIAVGRDGMVYVADTRNHRIQRFSATGAFLSAWGWGVSGGSGFEICIFTCQVGLQGGGAGQFDFVSGVAVGRDGMVYTAGDNNNRIDQFDALGNFVRAWGKNVDTTGDDGFEVCTTTCQAGSDTADLGAMAAPRGIAVGRDGTIYVTEIGNNRVQRFLGAAIILDDPVVDDGDAFTTTVTIKGLPAQTYFFDEAHSSLWTLEEVTCTGEVALSHSQDSDTFSLTLDAAEQTTCTLHNRERVSLTLVKDATPADGTDFTFAPTVVPLSAFGTEGEDLRQFDYVSAGAVAADGSIYVADLNINRVQHFDVGGNLIRHWGTPGTAEGQFARVHGVAVGPDGAVYVTELSNHRVQKFDAQGNFLRMWGHDVAVGGGDDFEVCTADCKGGVSGSGDGQFNFPDGIAVGADNTVYVADGDNHRIQQFNADGTFVRQWGSSGNTEGQFNRPSGIAVGHDGTVYVAGGNSKDVQHFTADGTFIRMWGSGVQSGTDQFEICISGCQGGQNSQIAGGLRGVADLAVAPDGSIYVTDNVNYRIAHYDPFGNFVRAFGFGVNGGAGFEVCTATCESGENAGGALGSFHENEGIAVGRDGSIFVMDTGHNRVQRVLGAAVKLDDAATDDNDGIGSSVQIKGLPAATYEITEQLPELWTMGLVNCNTSSSIFADKFTVTIAADEEATCTIPNSGPASLRLRKDASPADGTNFTFAPSLRNLNIFGQFGRGAGQFNYPDGVAVGPDGSIFVADYENHRIQRFDAFGNVIDIIGAFGTGAGAFNHPVDVAVAADGSLYVVEYDNHRVQQFDAVGTFVRMWGRGVDTGGTGFETCTTTCQAGSTGSGNGQFNLPLGIAIGIDGTVYVTDSNNNRVQRFNATGAHLGNFGAAGNGNGQFDFAFDVATRADGAVFVTDANLDRVQQFTATGDFVRVIGAGGSGAGQLDYPVRVAVMADGTILVTEFQNDRVSHFDVNGAFVRAFGWDVIPGGDTDFEVCTSSCKAGVSGNGVGQFNDPYGIAATPAGIFYVVDAANYRVQRFLGARIVLDDSDLSDADSFGNVELVRGLPSGSYNVAEVLPTGWEVDSINCTGATGTPNGNSVAVVLTSGAIGDCTFTNSDIDPTLTANVAIVGGGPLTVDDFPVFVDGNPVTRGAATTTSTGEHTVTQTNNPQYTASIGGACDSAGKVTLALAENKTCVVTNTYITQTLTVEVVVVGGGPLDAGDFPLFVDGTTVTRGAAKLLTAGLHVVTQTSDPRYAVSFGGACDGSGNVNVAIGSDVTCTITNTLLPVGTVAGVVWQDTNGNGLQDSGEPGVAGVTVVLDTAPDTVGVQAFFTTTTSANGSYLFEGLAPGDYQVTVVPPAGMEFTTALAGSAAQDSDAQQAKLTVQASGPITGSANSTLTYQLAYSNTGALTATGVVISTTIPANTTFDPAQNAGWACDAGATTPGTRCTLAVDDLAAGASATANVRLGVAPNATLPTTVTLTVAIRHSTAGSTAVITLPPAGSNGTLGAGLVPLATGRVTASAQTAIAAPDQEPEPPSQTSLFLPAIVDEEVGRR